MGCGAELVEGVGKMDVLRLVDEPRRLLSEEIGGLPGSFGSCDCCRRVWLMGMIVDRER